MNEVAQQADALRQEAAAQYAAARREAVASKRSRPPVPPLSQRPYAVTTHEQVVEEESPLLGHVMVSSRRVDEAEMLRLVALEGRLLPPSHGAQTFMLRVDVERVGDEGRS